jgi:hypothetical protein
MIVDFDTCHLFGPRRTPLIPSSHTRRRGEREGGKEGWREDEG